MKTFFLIFTWVWGNILKFRTEIELLSLTKLRKKKKKFAPTNLLNQQKIDASDCSCYRRGTVAFLKRSVKFWFRRLLECFNQSCCSRSSPDAWTYSWQGSVKFMRAKHICYCYWQLKYNTEWKFSWCNPVWPPFMATAWAMHCRSLNHF